MPTISSKVSSEMCSSTSSGVILATGSSTTGDTCSTWFSITGSTRVSFSTAVLAVSVSSVAVWMKLSTGSGCCHVFSSIILTGSGTGGGVSLSTDSDIGGRTSVFAGSSTVIVGSTSAASGTGGGSSALSASGA